jgi:hypothetical protein
MKTNVSKRNKILIAKLPPNKSSFFETNDGKKASSEKKIVWQK